MATNTTMARVQPTHGGTRHWSASNLRAAHPSHRTRLPIPSFPVATTHNHVGAPQSPPPSHIPRIMSSQSTPPTQSISSSLAHTRPSPPSYAPSPPTYGPTSPPPFSVHANSSFFGYGTRPASPASSGIPLRSTTSSRVPVPLPPPSSLPGVLNGPGRNINGNAPNSRLSHIPTGSMSRIPPASMFSFRDPLEALHPTRGKVSGPTESSNLPRPHNAHLLGGGLVVDPEDDVEEGQAGLNSGESVPVQIDSDHRDPRNGDIRLRGDVNQGEREREGEPRFVDQTQTQTKIHSRSIPCKDAEHDASHSWSPATTASPSLAPEGEQEAVTINMAPVVAQTPPSADERLLRPIQQASPANTAPSVDTAPSPIPTRLDRLLTPIHLVDVPLHPQPTPSHPEPPSVGPQSAPFDPYQPPLHADDPVQPRLVSDAYRFLSRVREQVVTLEEQLERKVEGIKTERDGFKHERDEFKSQIDELKISLAYAQCDTLRAEKTAVTAERDMLGGRVSALEKNLDDARTDALRSKEASMRSRFEGQRETLRGQILAFKGDFIANQERVKQVTNRVEVLEGTTDNATCRLRELEDRNVILESRCAALEEIVLGLEERLARVERDREARERKETKAQDAEQTVFNNVEKKGRR